MSTQLETIKVFAYPRSRPDGGKSELGAFLTYDTALYVASESLGTDLRDMYKPGQSAKQLYDEWLRNGMEVTIEPDDPVIPFSSIDFARLYVMQVANDWTNPLALEVTCIDTLIFPSGAAAPPQQWSFLLRAPATYADEGAHVMLRRATDFLYEDMSRSAMQSEGSSYKLLDMKVRELNFNEFDNALHAGNNALYYVQYDGGFDKTPPTPPPQPPQQ